MNYYVTKNYQRSVEALENWFKDKSNFPIKNISISPIICSEFPEDIEDKEAIINIEIIVNKAGYIEPGDNKILSQEFENHVKFSHDLIGGVVAIDREIEDFEYVFNLFREHTPHGKEDFVIE